MHEVASSGGRGRRSTRVGVRQVIVKENANTEEGLVLLARILLRLDGAGLTPSLSGEAKEG